MSLSDPCGYRKSITAPLFDQLLASRSGSASVMLKIFVILYFLICGVSADDLIVLHGSVPSGWYRTLSEAGVNVLVSSPFQYEPPPLISGAESLLIWNVEDQKHERFIRENDVWISEENRNVLGWKPGLAFWVEGRGQPIYLAGTLSTDKVFKISFAPGASLFGLPFTSPINVAGLGCAFTHENGNLTTELTPFTGYWAYNEDSTDCESVFGNTYTPPFASDLPIVISIWIDEKISLHVVNQGKTVQSVDILVVDWFSLENPTSNCIWSLLAADIEIPPLGAWKYFDDASQPRGKIYAAVSNGGDQDLDGLPDNREILIWGTDSSNPDSDGDGLADGREVLAGMNPLQDDRLGDADSDGMSNEAENFRGTDALDPFSINVNWYVDAIRGNDLHSGRNAIDLPLKTIKSALSKAIRGDTIHVADGTYYENIDDAELGVSWNIGNVSILSEEKGTTHE